MHQRFREYGVVLSVFWLLTGCCGVGSGSDSTVQGKETGVATTKPTTRSAESGVARAAEPRALDPRERRLRNLRQLTFGGENAEAYFSADGKKLVFQSTRPPYDCDQIFTMNVDGTDVRLVSTGTGRTTCAYFCYPHDDRILFSSTHEADASCPAPPDRSRGYVWPIYDSYEIWVGRPDGTDLQNLSRSPGYDAEATMSVDGSRIVFTSMRDGDLEIYTMASDGSDVRRLTHTPGYDGGAFFSADGKRIIYRAHHPQGADLEEYKALLAAGLVRPSKMEIFVMDADGSNARALTQNGFANFAPFMHPDGKRLLFASNLGSNGGREFDIYMINIDGSGLERITYTEQFDGFPMFTTDGRQLVFCSNRFNDKPGDTNVFLADWVD